MKKADIIAIAINASVLIFALSQLYMMVMFNMPKEFNITSPLLFTGFVLIVIVAHFCKMSRLFLIMLEQKINPWLFMETYAKTAFANLIIPYKLGEVYRFYCLSNLSGNYKIGLLSVIVDRFFDTLALIIFLVPMELYYIGTFNTTTVVLLAFLCICVVVYMAFPSIYTYLNRFLILNTKSKRSAKALGVLEEIHGWYLYSQGLIKNRTAILLVLSVVAWGLEYFALSTLYGATGYAFSGEAFAGYINSIFFVGTQPLTYVYFALSGIILAIITLIVYIIRKNKKDYVK